MNPRRDWWTIYDDDTMEFEDELERIDQESDNMTLNELISLAIRETRTKELLDVDHFEKDNDLFEV